MAVELVEDRLTGTLYEVITESDDTEQEEDEEVV